MFPEGSQIRPKYRRGRKDSMQIDDFIQQFAQSGIIANMKSDANQDLNQRLDKIGKDMSAGHLNPQEAQQKIHTETSDALYNHNARFAVAVIREYHEWLSQTYELTPKQD